MLATKLKCVKSVTYMRESWERDLEFPILLLLRKIFSGPNNYPHDFRKIIQRSVVMD